MANPGISCRGLVPLIKEQFQVELSKSLISNVIKQNNLSSPVGRGGQKIKKTVKEEGEFIENGGFFFLKAAELKLSLISRLAENLLILFPDFSLSGIEELIQVSIFTPFFKNKENLWLITGKEVLL
ncbi:MAG: hypothetical protein ABH914_04505, partial [Candidatus Omnitrophota bacterium]